MSGVWGNRLKLSIFGESHGKGIGVVIDGLPAGIELDLDFINKEMKRRAPGNKRISTSRKEKDEFNIISGYFNNKATGSPICCMIENTNQKSKDYESIRYIMRPGHADYTGNIKYLGANDYRGGGHFSGRLTAPLVFAGAIAKQILLKKKIVIGSHIKSIGNINDDTFNLTNIGSKELEEIIKKEFPVIDDYKGREMKEAIIKAKEDKDSLGGVIETAIVNLQAGVGEPFFDSIESNIAHMLFSIPGVKGVEFGKGFDITKMKGSEANDKFYIEKGNIKTDTNNNGGINGGISNGMPIIFNTAFKPTPSIGKKQRTVDLSKDENIEFSIKGRHDPCIVPRALVVVESVSAIALLDLIIERNGMSWIV
ncbi:MAG: chorismate synthase [Firmicutes bacterium]|nr:chorismate synthase [Bacillota bacterium]